MKINADQLAALVRVHKALIAGTFNNLLDVIADSVGSNPIEIKKKLFQLEKLKMIENLHVAGNAFTFEYLKSEPLSADMLVEECGFQLIAPDADPAQSDPKVEKIEALQGEKAKLEQEVFRLTRDLECLQKHGKTHHELVDGSLVKHGD
jgi:hypothetical protein